MSIRNAGLISSYLEGPDMPMDARFLARLPLLVMRRVLPENTYKFWLNIIYDQVSNLGYENIKFELNGENGFGDFIFLGWKDGRQLKRCEDCDGEGYFFHGQHEYECHECEGDGSVHADDSDSLMKVVISKSGVIDWESSVNAVRRISS